ncbi:MAG: UDP-N-acetylmuramate dehydrogenase [Lachnospiraceae bacterium]|nr:UDP-N-acetylmuramate dehydrogenase [Lachnospiraceae bacterium]
MLKRFYDELAKIISKNSILLDEPMKKHTTFRIGGNADMFVSPAIEQIPEIVALAKSHNIPVTIIGNGSNLLVGDKGIRGLVLSIGKGADAVEVSPVDKTVEGKVRLSVGAGALLSKVAAEALRNSLTGFEFAAGIPGTIGGAVVMNAGAYGGEIKDVLVSARVLTPNGEILTLTRDELDLSYRHSCIPEKEYIVLDAVLELVKGDEPQIRAAMEDYKGRRIEKQPLEYPSAGSTFKRPEGYFAGKLIQDADLRGYRVGGAQVSEKHCGFVINADNATAQDVLTLIEDVKKKVYEEFQVELEPEVKMMGEF